MGGDCNGRTQKIFEGHKWVGTVMEQRRWVGKVI